MLGSGDYNCALYSLPFYPSYVGRTWLAKDTKIEFSTCLVCLHESI